MSDERLTVIENDIKTIKENHLLHIEKDISGIKTTIAKVDDRMWNIMILIVTAALAQMFVPMVFDWFTK